MTWFVHIAPHCLSLELYWLLSDPSLEDMEFLLFRHCSSKKYAHLYWLDFPQSLFKNILPLSISRQVLFQFKWSFSYFKWSLCFLYSPLVVPEIHSSWWPHATLYTTFSVRLCSSSTLPGSTLASRSIFRFALPTLQAKFACKIFSDLPLCCQLSVQYPPATLHRLDILQKCFGDLCVWNHGYHGQILPEPSISGFLSSMQLLSDLTLLFTPDFL